MQRMGGWTLAFLALAASAAAQEPARLNKHKLRIKLVDGVPGPGTRARVLWVSRDLGATWQRAEGAEVFETTEQIYARVRVPADGSYAFFWQYGPSEDQLSPPPDPGRLPEGTDRVVIDTEPPKVTASLIESIPGQVRVQFDSTDNDRVAAVTLWQRPEGGAWKQVYDVRPAGNTFVATMPGDGPREFAVQAEDLARNVSDEPPFGKSGSIAGVARPALAVVIERHEPRDGKLRVYFRTAAVVQPESLELWWSSDGGATWARADAVAGRDGGGNYLETALPPPGRYGFAVAFTDTQGNRIPPPASNSTPMLVDVEIKPHHAQAAPADIAGAKGLYDRARWFLAQDRAAEAMAHLEEAVKHWPNYPDALSDLGTAYMKLNDPQRAVEYYRRSLAACPDDPVSHYNLASALLALKHWDDAFAALENAVRLMEEPHARLSVRMGDALMILARAYRDAGQAGRAAEAAGAVVRLPGATRFHRASADALLVELRKP